MDNKILIPLQSLVSCFLEPSVNRWVAVGAIEELWQGLLPSVFWRFHCLLRLSSCWVYLRVLKRVRVLCPQSSLCQGSGQWKLSTGQAFSRFSNRLWRGSLSAFSPLLFPPILQLLSPSMPLLTKYWAGHHLSISKSRVWNCLPEIGAQTHVAGTLCYA